MEHQTITIIGAGIAGLTTAVALNKLGIETQVFEASIQIKPLGAGLGLGINAMKAFNVIGIDQEIIQQGRTLPSFSIYDQSGKLISKTNFGQQATTGNFTIHRACLHQVLLQKLNPATIHLGKRLKGFENMDFGVRLIFEDGTTHLTNYVIIADGIHSKIRQQLLPTTRIRYAGYTCWRAVIKNKFLNINESSETWGAKGRFGIVPLADDQLYWFACINAEANNASYKAYQVAELRRQFEKYHSPIPDILECTENEHLIHTDIYDIKPIDRFAFGRIVLMGDAAHATTPNMGQGACQAIEDAVIIAQCMAQNPNYEEAFQAFEKRRVKRTKWVIDTSNSLGKIAQLENKYVITLRNAALRSLPKSISNKQLRAIEHVDF